MERKRSMQASVVLLMWAAMAAFLSQNLVISAANFEDQKNYFYFPPAVSYSPPSHSSGSSHATPSVPSKGSSGGTPPISCGKPPSSKGSSYHHTPKPSTPTPHPSTPSPTYKTPPITVTPPVTVTPPSPQSPPYTCIYWKNHPGLIWGVFGWWGTVGSAFNPPTNIPGFGPHTSLLQALSNTRSDGYGNLYREGTAALLNSMAPNAKFPYTSSQVKDGFVAALASNEAAAAQGNVFKMANEGKVN